MEQNGGQKPQKHYSEHKLYTQYSKCLNDFSYSMGAAFLYLLSSHCSGHVLKHNTNSSCYGPGLFWGGNEG